jgi:beta-galactosidase
MNLNINGIGYGGDYNPEQWPEKIWKEDISLMKDAGVNLVHIGIFSWAKLQKSENDYDFSWLDKIISMLEESGINFGLATSTAAQPAWMSKRYPDILPVDKNGNKIWYGSRQTYCPNSKSYRKFAANITEKIVNRYKDTKGLKLWHIHNEYGCHMQECYCDNCAEAFRKWLIEKYKKVENINKAWGTSFWGQTYYDMEEIIPPRITTAYHNPSQVLDYKRFMSDSILECFLNEKSIIKKLSPDIPVSTNFMQHHKPLDYIRWAPNIDIIAWDCYMDPVPEYDPSWAAINHDLMRSLGKGKPFILMEQATNHVNWMPVNTNKAPGKMRLWSYQAVAHGADAVMFFQWRQSLKGAEKFHSAMVTHTGDKNSRQYKEVSALGNELKLLKEIKDSTIESEAAIVFDYNNWWAVENDPRQSRDLHYWDNVLLYYRQLYRLNIPLDFVSQESDLSSYKIVIAPLMYMMKKGFKEKIEKHVSGGGIFITTFYSGVVDDTDGVYYGGYPGPLKDILGIEVEEYHALAPHMSNKIVFNKDLGNIKKGPYDCGLWCDIVNLKTAEALAVFGEDFYKGRACITQNNYGEGKAYYIASRPEEGLLKAFFKNVLTNNNIAPAFSVPEGVEISIRHNENNKYIFILNHKESSVNISLPDKDYYNLLSGEKITDNVSIDKNNLAVLKKSM